MCNSIDARILLTKVNSEWNRIQAIPVCRLERTDYLCVPLGWSFVTRIHARVELQNPKPSWNSKNTNRKKDSEGKLYAVTWRIMSTVFPKLSAGDTTTTSTSTSGKKNCWSLINPKKKKLFFSRSRILPRADRKDWKYSRIQSSSPRHYHVDSTCEPSVAYAATQKSMKQSGRERFLPSRAWVWEPLESSGKTYKRTFAAILFCCVWFDCLGQKNNSERESRSRYRNSEHWYPLLAMETRTSDEPWISPRWVRWSCVKY